MKIKVRRVDLLKKVQEALRRDEEAARQARTEYEAALPGYRSAVVTALRQAADRLEAGGRMLDPETHWTESGKRLHGVFVAVRHSAPAPPGKLDSSRYKKRLRELRLTSAEELTIDPWDNDWRGIV